MKGALEWPDNFPVTSEKAIAALKPQKPGIGFVKIILDFMEQNPTLDFGTPGPLVHFIESFPEEDYIPLVVRSLKSKPMSYTVWLLTRHFKTLHP